MPVVEPGASSRLRPSGWSAVSQRYDTELRERSRASWRADQRWPTTWVAVTGVSPADRHSSISSSTTG